MSHPARFKQADLTRALRAVMAAGHVVERIEIEPNGKIVMLLAGNPGRAEPNEWADLS